MSEEQPQENKKNWYEKSYKLLLILPAALLLFSVVYLFQFNAQHGDIVYKDVSLTGGTTITVFDENVNTNDLKSSLIEQFPDLIIRGISDIRTRKQQAFFLETTADIDEIKPALENYLGYKLNEENSSIEFSGSTLSQGFYQQLRIAIIIAFIFMALVVFFIFKTPIPSLAVIISAFADIVMTIVAIDILGISLSIGGIVAFLMLIGYSVDTDILLTTRILRRREGSLNERMIGAFKTGITMTLTSIAAVTIALVVIYSFSETLRQIFTILLIGLGFDIFNTWITNASILRWYAEAKNIE
ncbi:MAG: protein translocase subunit SecF [Nanoarchaeota archaeon]|nr:protein translocase subunit SecF [Nanoarchaeota archaeon]